MNILVTASDPNLGALWSRHLERHGMDVISCQSQGCTLRKLRNTEFDVLLLDMDLPSGGVMAIADYTNYRWPKTRVIFVTARHFFSDGSIFNFSSNACAFVPNTTKPDDLAALVEHHART